MWGGRPMHPSREKIERLLLNELEITKNVYEQRRNEFRAVISEIPSGIPQPDNQIRIENARVHTSAALELYTRALREFNEFVLNGVVPERMKQI
jgi:hypothetical protein